MPCWVVRAFKNCTGLADRKRVFRHDVCPSPLSWCAARAMQPSLGLLSQLPQMQSSTWSGALFLTVASCMSPKSDCICFVYVKHILSSQPKRRPVPPKGSLHFGFSHVCSLNELCCRELARNFPRHAWAHSLLRKTVSGSANTTADERSPNPTFAPPLRASFSCSERRKACTSRARTCPLPKTARSTANLQVRRPELYTPPPLG